MAQFRQGKRVSLIARLIKKKEKEKEKKRKEKIRFWKCNLNSEAAIKEISFNPFVKRNLYDMFPIGNLVADSAAECWNCRRNACWKWRWKRWTISRYHLTTTSEISRRYSQGISVTTAPDTLVVSISNMLQYYFSIMIPKSAKKL